MCQPIQLAVLANNGDSGSIVLDSANVYVSYGYSTGGGAVASVPLVGGTLTNYATYTLGGTAFPTGIGVNGSYIAFTVYNTGSTGTVTSCKFPGCSTWMRTIGPMQTSPGPLVVDSTWAYWSASSGILYTDLANNFGVSPFATGYKVANLAIDANNVYWTGSSSTAAGVFSTPRAMPPATPPVTTLTSISGAQGIAVDSTFVYFSVLAQTSRISKVAIGSNNATPTTLVTTGNHPIYLATDGAFVYWPDGGSIAKCPVTGCSGAVNIAPNRNSPQAIAVDSLAVYWLEYGAVMKVAK
jgi:hypothetical protein